MSRAQTPIVQAKDLTVSLGTQIVLENVTFQIQPAEMIGIVGPNGAGKTTLLKVLLGLIKPKSGEIQVLGGPPHRLGAERHNIGYVPQRGTFNRRFPISVVDVVAMGRISCRGLFRRLTKEDRQAALDSLERVNALDIADKPIGELSGGQQQRAFLARALCSHTELLLLDEPNTGLDPPAQAHFLDLLKTLRDEEKLTIIVVSHDLSLISKHADKLMCINRTVHIHGSPSEVLDSPNLSTAYACEFDRFVHGRNRGIPV